jgi:hypothetical protein
MRDAGLMSPVLCRGLRVPELPLHDVEPFAVGLEEPGAELVVEEEVALAVGERFVALSRFVAFGLLGLDLVPEGVQ